MEQTQLTAHPSFLEKWTPRLNLGMLTALGILLIVIMSLSFILTLVAIGNGDGPAPHDAFVEATNALLGFFGSCFKGLLFIAGVVLPITNVLYLKRYWSTIPKKQRFFSAVVIVATGLLVVFVVISGLVAVVMYHTFQAK